MVKENKQKTMDLKSLFYPEQIAFIGASPNSSLGSMLYLKDFKDSRWSDTFYPVNPKHDEILGWKCYPTVLDIPNEIDTAYISVKTKIVPQVLKECVEKGVRWVIIFASGFSETGDRSKAKTEERLSEIIEGSPTRIIGPNCLGPYNGIIGMSFSFAARPKVGTTSFMSQSGGHLSQLLDIGVKRDLRFRYGISFGNQVDLNCVHFLRFFRKDPKTRLIAAYLESFGSANGYEFFRELQKTTKIKPVIIWKGGYTKDGSRAAFSHTGAMASDFRMWKTMIKQTGAVGPIEDNEEFWNTIKTFELLFPNKLPRGRNVGIITPGGGSSVNMTDLLASHNLNVPVLTQESQDKLRKILPKENVNIANPLDLGAAGFIVNIFHKAIEITVQDPNVDIIFVPLWTQHIFRYVFKRMTKIQKSTSKPFVFCLPSLADSADLVNKFDRAKKVLHRARSLYFFSLREAAKSISHLCVYAEYLHSKK